MQGRPTALPMIAMLVGAMLASGVIAYGAYRVLGWLGIGVFGLLMAFVAVQAEMDDDAPIGSQQTATLYADSQRARDQMSRSERAAQRAESRARRAPLLIAKAAGVVLACAGLAGFFVWQLPH